MIGTYDLDGDSFAAEIHRAGQQSVELGSGQDWESFSLSETLETDPAHLTRTNSHENGINVKATFTQQTSG